MRDAQSVNQRFRTNSLYNLHVVGAEHCDEWGFPTLMPEDFVPQELVSWADRRTQGTHDVAGVHFFVDDYRFESLWNRPSRYIQILSSFGAALTPDFSLYSDMPIPMQIWNTYRSRALGNYWQRSGITVIPTLQWSTEDSYAFSFGGLPTNSVVAVSTVGVMKSDRKKALWADGMLAALELLNPAMVIGYGLRPDWFDFGDTLVEWFEGSMHRRFADGRQGSI